MNFKPTELNLWFTLERFDNDDFNPVTIRFNRETLRMIGGSLWCRVGRAEREELTDRYEEFNAPGYYKLTRGQLIGVFDKPLRDIDDYLFSKNANQNQNGDFEINNCLDVDTVVLYDGSLEADFDREFKKWSVHRFHYSHFPMNHRLRTPEAFCNYVTDLPALLDGDIISARVIDHVGYVMRDFYETSETCNTEYRYSSEFPIVEKHFRLSGCDTDGSKLSRKEIREILNRISPVDLTGDGFQRFA